MGFEIEKLDLEGMLLIHAHVANDNRGFYRKNFERNIFAENDYAEYSQLMFDTAKGEEKVSTKDANNKIREIMFSVLGVDENCSRKELRKAIRRHKIDVFEIIAIKK